MAQRQVEWRERNYIFSFDARIAFDNAPHGALHLILRHLAVPPAVIDPLLLLQAAARLRIATAHGLTQPVHMQHGITQGTPESPLLYALLLELLLSAQEYRIRPAGGAERGLIQAYINNLLVVAHTLQNFGEDVEAVAAELGMTGMELNLHNCAMATTEGVPGLHLGLCPGHSLALGAGSGLRPLPGAPAAAKRGVFCTAQAPATPGGGTLLVVQHARAAQGGTAGDRGDPGGVGTVRCPLHH